MSPLIDVFGRGCALYRGALAFRALCCGSRQEL
jgi:hypothetical protein